MINIAFTFYYRDFLFCAYVNTGSTFARNSTKQPYTDA